jgi:hypothetical protein
MSGDPTMAGVKDPFKRLEKLAERRLNLELQILEKLDQISCMEHEQDEILKDLNSEVVWVYRRK